LIAPGAWAQAAGDAPVQTGGATGLEEIVVTATRQTNTVNRVPLSIAAFSQENLDQQGIKNAADIIRLVPGLSVNQNNNASPGVMTFSIRGIVGGTGSATTGTYLDDTNLAKRANNGVNQNNGAPSPILFDLERVEVLKGPQGTLYGGSSQGGTVRFITPNPSLTTYSGMARLEGSKIKLGEEGYQFGVAVGGPILRDKVGFRLSVTQRKTPGYVDSYAPYGPVSSTAGVNPAGYAQPGVTLIKKDANSVIEKAISGKLLWQINDRGSVMFTAYASRTETEGGSSLTTDVYSGKQDGSRASASETFTTPTVCLGGTRQAPLVQYDPNIPLGQDTRVAAAFSPGNVNCATANAANTPGFFVRQGATYGPFPQRRDINYRTTDQQLQPASTQFETQSVVLNYDFGTMTVKSITSFVHDLSKNVSAGGEDQTQKQTYIGAPAINTNLTNPAAAAGVTVFNSAGQPVYAVINPNGSFAPTVNTGNVGATGSFPLWAAKPDYPGLFTASSRRNAVQEELRFASDPNARPLTWVAGMFYSNNKIHQLYYYADRGLDASVRSLFGISEFQRYGVNTTAQCQCNSYLNAQIGDTEMAGYGEANLYITDKLHLTAGIRLSRLTFDFYQINFSAFGNRYDNMVASYTKASSKDAPTTPKFGATYEFTPNDLVYVTAAKGFRAGGANSPVSPTVCAPALLQLFGQNTDPVADANLVPPTFGPDTVWSYEAGGKFRLFNGRMQVNGAGYRIDWKGVQSTFALSCGLSFVTNGGGARSEGFDLQTQFRPISPLTLTFNAAYTNSRYLEAVTAPKPATGKLYNAGDNLAVPKWQISASAQYDTEIYNHGVYARIDYQYQSKFNATGTAGTSAYNPFTAVAPARDLFNARAGVRVRDDFEVNVFALNLFDSKDQAGNGATANAGNGRSTCNNVACSSYVGFTPFVQQAYWRPREIGIQANYRF
jgi:outer membrane receptor protein involved in Fe transport